VALWDILAKKQVVPVILDGLRRPEYRGYDSAGMPSPVNGCKFAVSKASCATLRSSSVSDPWMEPTASATPAGPPTGARLRRTPTRTATARARSSSFRTESSKTTSPSR
jgi:hypothetical protein